MYTLLALTHLLASPTPARAPEPLRLETITRVHVAVLPLSEGNRLATLGAFDADAVLRAVTAAAREAGVATDGEASEARLQAEWVCAGPDTGRVGCSVALVLRALAPADGGTRVPTYEIWRSPRSLYLRDGWRAMGEAAPALMRELAAEFVAERRARQARASGAGS